MKHWLYLLDRESGDIFRVLTHEFLASTKYVYHNDKRYKLDGEITSIIHNSEYKHIFPYRKSQVIDSSSLDEYAFLDFETSLIDTI